MRAILSVSDKAGLVDFAKGLTKLNFEIFSTGGTKDALKKAGVPVHSVSDITSFPEILDGRVKTLHPAVHGGILAKRNARVTWTQLAEKGIGTIDMVVVNLYPFVQTIAKEGVTLEDALENIDIGGPTMIRAAAKNFPDVIVVVDPADYMPVLEELAEGQVGLELRRKLAQKAFQHVAYYDTAIAQYLRGEEKGFPDDDHRPEEARQSQLRRKPASAGGLLRGRDAQEIRAQPRHRYPVRRQGISFNNILDLESAVNAVMDFPPPTVAIIKHNNPCGLCSHDDLAEAYRRALAGDPLAAFGGVVASNRTIDMAAAEEIYKTHYDAIVAPKYDR